MAEPPRLRPILLPWEKSIIYFVTICVENRKPVLANETMFAAIKRALTQLKRWQIYSAVIMPDHIHALVSPMEDRDASVGDFCNGFKRLLRRQLGTQDWRWQRGCFDRLLRTDESVRSKWIYVEDNPVRAGFVRHRQDWPYRIDFVNEDGKLTASPTARIDAAGANETVGEAVSFPHQR